MSDAVTKSATHTSAPAMERRPRAMEPSTYEGAELGALQTLQQHSGNCAVNAMLCGGVPLSAEVRAEMETRFGESFDSVRVHDDHSAHSAATTLRADAYTHGNHIFFNAEQYAPHTYAGKQLLAHELAHVVQQSRGGASRPRTDGAGSLETEAHRASQAVSQNQSAQVTQGSAVGIAASPWSERWQRLKDAAAHPEDTFEAAKQAVVDTSASLYNKASAKYDQASASIHQAAYNFDANAAEHLADQLTPIPLKISEGLDALADKAKGSSTWEAPARNFRNTVKPLATAFRDANRDVMREALVGKGLQSGIDQGIDAVDKAAQGLFQRYEQNDFQSEAAPEAKTTDTPLADAANKYRNDPNRLLREGETGVAQALWKLVPGIGRMVNHPVATLRGLGNMPSVADPTGLFRTTGVTTGLLWDTAVEGKPIAATSQQANAQLQTDPAREWRSTVGMLKGLTHDWVKTYDEGRPVAATTHAVTDVAMFLLPFLDVGKAATTADTLNAVSKAEQTANTTSKLATTTDALSTTADVAKSADELGSATKSLGEVADATPKQLPGPARGIPDSFFDDALAQFDNLENPFTSGFGKKTLDKLRNGIDVAGDRAMRPHIDEPLAVGADVKPQRQVDRALDPQNRQFLDPATNVQTKHLGTDARDIARNRNPLDPVSLADPGVDPSVVFTRRFGEITELRQVFEDAVAKIRDLSKYSPTKLKAKINANIIDMIREGSTPASTAVRDALNKLGYEYVPGEGLTAVKPTARVPTSPASTIAGAQDAAADAASNGTRFRVETSPQNTATTSPANAAANLDEAAEIEMLQDQQAALLEQAARLRKRYLPSP